MRTRIRRLSLVAAVSLATFSVLPAMQASADTGAPVAQAPVADSSTGITPMGHSECRTYLENRGYPITNTRNSICAAASFPFPGQQTRFAICVPALYATDVSFVDSNGACVLAVF
jgi:hypothetical protein